MDINWIIEKMVGKTLSAFLPRAEHEARKVILEVRSLSYPRPEGGMYVEDFSFQVHAGEIVGLYGLMGAGRSELLECLIGLHPEAGGQVAVDEQGVSQGMSVDERIALGLILVPEDRQAAGIVQSMTVANNMTLASLASYTRMGVLPRKAGACGNPEDARATFPSGFPPRSS